MELYIVLNCLPCTVGKDCKYTFENKVSFCSVKICTLKNQAFLKLLLHFKQQGMHGLYASNLFPMLMWTDHI